MTDGVVSTGLIQSLAHATASPCRYCGFLRQELEWGKLHPVWTEESTTTRGSLQDSLRVCPTRATQGYHLSSLTEDKSPLPERLRPPP